MSNLQGNQPGSKHVPGAIAILLAGKNYDPVDNGKRVRLVRLVLVGSKVELRYQGLPMGLIYNTAEFSRVWEVEAVDSHLHLTANAPLCMDNNCYLQQYLLIIGDESLVKDEPTVEELRQADTTWNIIHKELAKL